MEIIYNNINIHTLSPFIYIIYVDLLESNISRINIKPSKILYIRKIHNIILSLLSLFMLIGIIYCNYIQGKFDSLYNLLCLPYDNEKTSMIVNIFLYSKYLEWGDTLFLCLSRKKVSMLHYTHHMTTVILVYTNMIDYINPFLSVFMGLNCFIHVWMYWYFSFPKGRLYPYRIYITQGQLIQHLICIIAILYIILLDNCQYNIYGIIYGTILYIMYFVYFSIFYINTYLMVNKE